MNIMNFATRNVVSVLPDDSIDKAICLMEERGFRHLPVQVDGRVVGMVSDRDILLSTGWALEVERQAPDVLGQRVVGPTRIEQIMSRPAVSLSSASTAGEAARLMLERKIGALPVVQGGRTVGIVTETDLLHWLEELASGGSPAARFLDCPVRELMRVQVVTVRPEQPLSDVIDVFRRYRVRHVPVAVNDRLVGILSDRDVRRVLGWASVHMGEVDAAGREVERPRAAGQVMQREVRTASPADTLREALHLMLRQHIHALPVVENERLVGILTQTDFIKAIARQELL